WRAHSRGPQLRRLRIPVVPDLRDRGGRADRHRAALRADAHAHRRHGPRRRRRPRDHRRDGSEHRLGVHRHVRRRRGARRDRRHDRRRHPEHPPRRAERGAALRAGRHHHRRARQHRRRGHRQRADRTHRRFREGLDPGARLLHHLPAHGARAGPATNRPVRKGGIMSNRIVETRTVRTFGAPRRGRTWFLNIGLLAALLVVAVALPYLGVSSFVVTLTTTIVIAATLASSVNCLAGPGGMVSLGHAGIAAAAAYGAGWASKQGFDPGMQALVALVLTVLVSLIYGLLSMRTSGIYFLMVTLAVGMLIYGLAFRLSSVTGGENGISGIDRPAWMSSYWVYYYVVLALFVLATGVLWVVANSPFGASLRGVRDSESRMRSLGYGVQGYRVGAFLISGLVAGLAG